MTMPLSRDLANVTLTHRCPNCGHPFQRSGAWFSACGRYRCSTCQHEVRLGYQEKVQLFEQHKPSGAK
jgi:DNA-directed RNA polymerase subunit RPC12/RpoP